MVRTFFHVCKILQARRESIFQIPMENQCPSHENKFLGFLFPSAIHKFFNTVRWKCLRDVSSHHFHFNTFRVPRALHLFWAYYTRLAALVLFLSSLFLTFKPHSKYFNLYVQFCLVAQKHPIGRGQTFKLIARLVVVGQIGQFPSEQPA